MSARLRAGHDPPRRSAITAGQVREAGDSALLLQLDARIDPAINARAIAIADAVRSLGIRGLRDVVATYRSVAVYFDPLVVETEAVRETLERATAAAEGSNERHDPDRRPVELPIAYGGQFGPDLDELAAYARLTTAEVIQRHTSATYRVFMLGFLPGFPYMGVVPPEIAMPRKTTPRVRVTRGSVGIAGMQTGIYPTDAPGGWQIIGRTPVELFDVERVPPARLRPGDRVRFVAIPELPSDTEADPAAVSSHVPSSAARERSITLVRPGLFTTVQDVGRWGYQSEGVPVSGAMDSVAHRTANALVGNHRSAATLEVTLVGPEIRVEHAATIALAGADLSATVDGKPVPVNQPTRCNAGSLVRFGERRVGIRTYVAFDGGIEAPLLLGSRSMHVRSALGGIGGRPLAASEELLLGAARTRPDIQRTRAPIDTTPSGAARVRVLPGPQDDMFPPEALDVLQQTRFRLASQSDRMGYRLLGGRLPRRDGPEMISDATFGGAIQVPTSGEPILLMADRQTTGGYPQIATVITADLPHVAQLGPGDSIEFRVCTRAEALQELAEQERRLRAFD